MEMVRNTESALPAGKVRRHRSKQERRLIVEETLEPGVSVAVIARTHGVNANQVFQWRKLYSQGRLGATSASPQLLPVRMSEVVEAAPVPVRVNIGVIHIELGRARIRIEGAADVETLRAALEQLGQ